MIIGIGIDLCEINRMVALLENHKFLERFFTKLEIDYIMQKGAKKADSMAVIFAGKEAALKAFGTGMAGINLKDIEISHMENGRPYYILHGTALEKYNNLGGKAICLSLTHEAGMAAAVAVLEG